VGPPPGPTVAPESISEEAGQVHAEQQDTHLGACVKHFAERAVARCDDCGELWCATCMAPKVRKRAPTRCIECALVAGGVRAPGTRRANMTDMNRHKKRPTNLF
jgi:hypothetical protein